MSESEAIIYHARCLIRNCENIESAEKILKQQMDYNIKGDTLQKRINFVNACLGIDEMKCWQISAYWEEIGLTPLDREVFSSWINEIGQVQGYWTLIAEYTAIALFVHTYVGDFHWDRYRSNFGPYPEKRFDKDISRACFRHGIICELSLQTWMVPNDVLGLAHVDYWQATRENLEIKERLKSCFRCLERRTQSPNGIGVNHGELIIKSLVSSERVSGKVLSEISAALENMKKHNFGKFDSYCSCSMQAGHFYFMSGDFEKAIECYTKAIETWKSYKRTKKNYELIMALSYLAHVYTLLQEWDFAANISNEAITLMENVERNRWHHKLAACYNRLGSCYMMLSKFDAAEQKFNKRNQNASKLPDDEIAEVTKLWNVLNDCEFSYLTLNSQKSQNLLRQANKMYSKLNGHDLTIQIYSTYGYLCETVVNSLEKAEQFYRTGSETPSGLFSNHPLEYDCLLGMASVSLKQKKIQESEEYAFRSLQSARQFFHSDPCFTEPLVHLFGKLLKQRKDISKEHAVFEEYCKRFQTLGFTQNSYFVASLALNFAKENYSEGLGKIDYAEMLDNSSKVSFR